MFMMENNETFTRNQTNQMEFEEDEDVKILAMSFISYKIGKSVHIQIVIHCCLYFNLWSCLNQSALY